MIVEHRVYEGGAHLGVVPLVAWLTGCGASVPQALCAADVAPAAAVGDVAELLDVDVDQRAGVGVLVASDRFSGGPVDVGESVEAAPHQHRVSGGGSTSDLVGDLDRAESVLPAQVHDLADHRRRGPGRRMVRPRRGVVHRVLTEPAVPIGPAFGGRPGHVIALGGPSDGPALLDDQPGQPQSRAWRQCSVSVGHEDLQGEERFLRQLHSTPGGLRLPSSFRSCRHTISTNVPDQYT